MAPPKKDLRDAISKELGAFIESKSSTFACGGFVPIETNDGNDTTSKGAFAPPSALRWDSADTATGIAKLNFPIDATNEEQKAALMKLIKDCQPASFGYKGEDVLDESYRKATKMDRSAFSVDFCPYELGIVDTIAQVLLPNAGSTVGTKGIKAELYKLNIYAAPSGFFKAHVDTPRSDAQFGSLVVSLPCHHEGGQLVVRHAGHSVTFDWGASGSGKKVDTAVQWAAFYSDCEHEVLEVTQGHRITLTYNLYYTPGVGDLAGNSPLMDVKSLPLFKKIETAIADPAFMAEGGYLGVYCQHAYAHTTSSGAKALPSTLKGSDMAVYSIFKALNLDIAVRPILDIKKKPWYFKDERKNMDYAGPACKKMKVTERGGSDEDYLFEGIFQDLEGDWLRVNWLTRPVSKEVAFVHLTYGNEPGINIVYAHAALVVTVIPASQRKGVN